MNSRENRLVDLRERAQTALQLGETAIDRLDEASARTDVRRLVEELRVYQAELEIQNEELVSAQLTTDRTLARYTLLFQNIPMPALVLDARGVIQECNAQATDFFGFNKQSALRQHSVYRLLIDRGGHWLGEVLHHSDDDMHSRIVKGLWLRSGQGDKVLMDAHIIRLSSEYHLDGHTLMLLADRSIEHERDHERLVFQSILDNSSAMIYAFDRDGHCILANNATLQSMGVTRDSLIGERRSEHWLKSLDSEVPEHGDQTVFDTGQAQIFEETLRTDAAGERHFVSNKFLLRDPAGEDFAVGCIATDVTQSRDNELRLQLAMQVFSKGSEGIMISDQENRIISVNNAFEIITGYPESEALGRTPSMLASGKHDKAFYKSMWTAIEATGHWEGEIYNRRKSGELYPQWLNASRVCANSGETTHYISVFSDISHRKLAEEEIERLAFYDVLTGTPNRYLLHDRVKQAVRGAQRDGTHFTLMFLDLDRFKEVNDVFGHEIGDQLIIEVSHRLQAMVREQDTVCRLGGDEFVLLLDGMDQERACFRAEAFLATIIDPYVIEGHSLTVSASIGVAVFPRDGDNYKTLLKHADTAMYQAKAGGRNAYNFFSVEMADRAVRRSSIEFALRSAIQNGEFWLAYQPQICLVSGKLLGVEALLRWDSATLGSLPPDTFISIAEECGLILPLGSWVLREALAQMRSWRDSGLSDFAMSVNISPAQFWRQDLVGEIAGLLEATGVPPHLLDLELTEQLAMKSPEESIAIMQRLRAIGVTLSIDDFGTGYSSLAYLSRLPLQTLKIDKSFVHAIGESTNDEIIVRSIIQLARTLGINTVAEGVETETHARFLLKNGCDTAQGFYYAHPLAAVDFLEWLEQRETAHQTSDLQPPAGKNHPGAASH